MSIFQFFSQPLKRKRSIRFFALFPSPANVLKEIVEGRGAVVYAPRFSLGDPSLSLEELWCAEYQESNAIAFLEEEGEWLRKVARRERCGLDCVGEVMEGGNVSRVF